MDWVPGRTWGWLGPSGSVCNELFIGFLAQIRSLALSRLHGLPCDLCGGWAIVSFSTFVPFQPFEVGLVTAPCPSLLHPFPSQRFVAT
jgi:hypothetical protein